MKMDSPSSHNKVHQEHAEPSTLTTNNGHGHTHASNYNSDDITVIDLPQAIVEKGPQLVDSHIPLLTWRSVLMGIFVSMGGFIFGYDTGQISGFLQMKDFLYQFGTYNGSSYEFSNVRSGLITALVCLLRCLVLSPTTIKT